MQDKGPTYCTVGLIPGSAQESFLAVPVHKGPYKVSVVEPRSVINTLSTPKVNI